VSAEVADIRLCARPGCGRPFEPSGWNHLYCCTDCARAVSERRIRERDNALRAASGGQRAAACRCLLHDIRILDEAEVRCLKCGRRAEVRATIHRARDDHRRPGR
jgi:hypothetical protein